MLTSVADRDILIIEDTEPAPILLSGYLKKLGFQKIKLAGRFFTNNCY